MIDGPPEGHIKVSRKVFDAEHGDPLWLKPREFSQWEAWIDVIQLAAWKPVKYQTQFGVVTLARGEFIASRRHLAKRWRWSEKAVRVWLSTLQKGARLRAQRETESGMVYLIVKYDHYQSTPTLEKSEKGPGQGHARAQQGPKKEAVKAVRTKKLTDADASAANLAAFPRADCDAGFERWVSKIGAMDYGRFRKALLPVFVASPLLYSGEQLAAGVEAFHEAMQGDDPKWRGKWTVNRFAAEIHNWVRLGGQELVDDWGMPTERGIAAGVFAA